MEVDNDLLLNNVQDVRHYSTSPEDNLLLTRPIEGGDSWSIEVRDRSGCAASQDFPLSEQVAKLITIQRMSGILGKDATSYRLFRDGTLRRWDMGDVYGKSWKQEELERKFGVEPELRIVRPGEMSIDALRELAARSIQHLMASSVPNQRLEVQMGLNGQPIGFQKLDGLIEFVSSPDVAVTRL